MAFRRSLATILVAVLWTGAASAPAGAAKAKSYKNCTSKPSASTTTASWI